MKNILCVKWGEKYNNDYVEKLKKQIEDNCNYNYNFYCLTDNPQTEYDIKLPTTWDRYYDSETKHFWAYRKCYIFNEDLFPDIKGDEFLFFDLDVLFHKSINKFFELNMDNPWIVRGWWNDTDNCKKNYSKLKSTPLNSSIIRWNRGQLKPIYDEIVKFTDIIFFTYSSIDNYFNQRWYDIHNEDGGYFKGFEKGMVYSWYKGNIYSSDMDFKKLRKDHTVCLFNNSTEKENEHMNQISELNNLW